MNSKRKKIALLGALLVCLVSGVSASTIGMASLSAGNGLTLSSKSGIDNLFCNPAHLSFSGFEWRLGSTALSTNNSSRSVMKFIGNNLADLTEWNQLTPKRRKEIRAEFEQLPGKSIEIAMLPSAGMAFRKFAFGAVAKSNIEGNLIADQSSDTGDINLNIAQTTEAIFAVGMSNLLFNRLALGVRVSYIQSWSDRTESMQWQEAQETGEWLQLLWDNRSNVRTGYAIAAGASFRLNSTVSIDYSTNDLASSIQSQILKPGSRLQISAEFNDRFITSLLSARTIRVAGGLFGEQRVPLATRRNAGLALEVGYPILTLRGGYGNSHHSIGASVNLALVEIGYAQQVQYEGIRTHTAELTLSI